MSKILDILLQSFGKRWRI